MSWLKASAIVLVPLAIFALSVVVFSPIALIAWLGLMFIAIVALAITTIELDL